MADKAATTLEAIGQFLAQRPDLASQVEALAAHAQGKGSGSASIQQENNVVLELLARTPALSVDVGANIGDYTTELRNRNPAMEIHVFEPARVNVEKLKVRFGADRNIHLNQLALSNTTGAVTLFSNSAGSGLASLNRRRLDHFGLRFDVEESVSSIRFEDYWADVLGRRVVDIAKLDVEGHELAVLDGFGQAVDSTRVIQFEFGGCNIDTRTFFQDFWYFFAQRNFAIFRIAPHGAEPIPQYRESDEFFETTNFVAINKSLA